MKEKGKTKRLLSLAFALVMMASITLGAVSTVAAQDARVLLTDGGVPTSYSKSADEWNQRHQWSAVEAMLLDLNESYPELTALESVGKSWEDRDLWCLTITDPKVSDEGKTGIGVMANIHGGERESAESALYTACWFLENTNDPTVQEILKKHILYVIPVINPDGYVQSSIYNTRYNMRPTDRDGDGIPFSDNYEDIDGDGYIAAVYAATSADRSAVTGNVGMESGDANGDGLMGNDPKSSGIDMNRNFDYKWGEGGTPASYGPYAASEPEVQAIQKFLAAHQMDALTTLHTGIQCVLYPWGYRDTNTDDPDEVADIEFMAAAAERMRRAYETTTHRNFYVKNSYNDYQTYSELLDYAYGNYGIHTYTIEVYSGGSNARSAYDPAHDPSDDSVCKWNNTLPSTKWVFYTHDEIASVLGLDWTTLKKTLDNGSVVPLDETDGLYFSTTSTSQMVDRAPEDQYIMVQGARDSILQMIYSEGKVSDPMVSSVYQEPSQKELMNNLEKISGDDGVGPHSMGTPEEKAVAEMIAGQIQSYNPAFETRVLEQSLAGTRYENRITTLGNILLDGEWPIYGPYFGPGDMDYPRDAQIADCGTGTEAEMPNDLSGKIALIERTSSGTASTAETAAIALAEERGAGGIIYTCKDYEVKSGASSQMRGTKSNIPMMLIIKEYADRLNENMDKIQAVTKYSVNKTYSAQAILPAKSGEPDAIVYVISHLDSVIGSVAANDNGSGTAVVMELARLYAQVESNVEIRFMCFGGEESGLIGSRLYAGGLSHEEIKNTLCVLNMDEIATNNPEWNRLSVEVVDGTLNLSAALMLNSVGELPWLPSETHYRLYKFGSTDHQSFDEVGIDAAGMFRGNTTEASEPPNHTAADTIENNISPERLLQGASIVSKALATVIDAHPSKSIELETKSYWNKAAIIVNNTDQVTGLSEELIAEVTGPDGETQTFILKESSERYQLDVFKTGKYKVHFYSRGTGVTNWGNFPGETYAEDCYTIELGTYTVHVNLKPINTALLSATVQYAEDLAEAGGLQHVIASVAKEFNRALTEGKSVLEKVESGNSTVTQDEIDTTVEALINALHYLEFKGDKTDLLKIIAIAEGFETQKEEYISSTFAPFEEALIIARITANDGDALNNDIEAAWKDLYRTILELRFIPNKDKLADLLAAADALDTSLYTTGSVFALKAAADLGTLVMADDKATEEEVEEAVTILSAAINGLERLRAPEAHSNTSSTDSFDNRSGGDSAEANSADNPKTGDTGIVGVAVLVLLGSSAALFYKKRNTSRNR